MIKARNKKLSMLLVLAMLMTMFVGVGSATAAGTVYTTLTAPTISTNTDDYLQLGKVSIDIADIRTIPYVAASALIPVVTPDPDDEDVMQQLAGQYGVAVPGEWFTISLPSGCEFHGAAGDATLPELADSDLSGLEISPSDDLAVLVMKQSSKNTMEVRVARTNASPTDRDGSFLLDFHSIKVKSGSGNVDATFLAPGDGTFPMGTATIAKIGSGSTTVMAKSVKTIGDAGGEIDTIIIAENRAGVFENGEKIELRLPKGFTWVDNGVVQGAWGLAGQYYTAQIGSSDRILEVLIGGKVSTASAGRVNIGTSEGFFEIEVEDSARFGDVYVTVSSSKDSVEKQDVLVATYGDYGVKVVEDTKEDVDSGRANQELGEFLIEEALPESLDSERSLYFELPKGVKWAVDENDEPIIELKSEDGTSFDYDTEDFELSNGDRKMKVSFTYDSGRFSEDAAKIRVKGMEVNVEPSFEGDIAITVSGKAGAEGEAVVGTAARPVTLKVENPTKVEIGAMNQQAGDILIIENKDEAILDEYLDSTILEDEYDEVAPQIVINLPKGVEFYKDPTVEVEEGDLEIDDVEYYDGSVVIFIDAASSKASTIRISDVFLTVDRTVPEGDVVATFAGHEVDDDLIEAYGSSALVNWATEESYGKVTIATTITPSQGGHAKFVIGSNIYEIGGVPYVMDAVPYIKDSRSYVPMRYLAEMIGAEIEWSEADQTVTLTKEGETEVVFTIGSTSYTVNGEAMTADVAPEIVNDRSFLPARFAAEAFGAQVGWDEATQTVIIIR